MEFEKRFSAKEAMHHSCFQDFKSKKLYNKITERDAMKTLYKNLKNYKRK